MSTPLHRHTHSDEVATGEELHDLVAKRLTERGQRYTSGRRRLIEALVEAEHPMTLPAIVAGSPDVAPSSAYRNLDLLESAGVIRRISSGGDHAHFELAEPLLHHHHHLICVDCGTIVDIHLDDELEDLVDERLSKAAVDAGFTPISHSLDVHGRCPTCTKAASV